ncbi:hypothetical protein PPACK8108_LOCUS20497 [Phakopsora pachyrhizi]|uniref:Yeast cell wall synthesis Kre9/Knh1-like N-terminal domain-containing protein n=1 Tax=Phakopsora pachyrhizi TaxID=170000 RepID=A0AAV0BHX0_PHAPC|nr:hypothetical protein PPACK8108_LOCUS20497 [Phakopsora pachyrhizi]
MRFSSFCVGIAGLTASAKALTITSPSASSYWVQFSTNTIAWSLSNGDPTDVTLQVINRNSTTLNGVFTIAEYVKASLESYTVTNVTLVTAEEMVNPMNNSQVYATSGTFGVKPSGTTPAPVTGPSGQTSANGTSSTGPNGTAGSRNGTAGSSFGNGTASGNAHNSPANKVGISAVMGIVTLTSALKFAVL